MIQSVGRYLLSAALVLVSKDALRQALGELRDTEPGSQLFAALQLVIGVSAAVGAIGVFRRARWAMPAIATWGITTAGLVAVQPLFEPMDTDAKQGIWIGAGAVLAAAAAAGWYARRLAAQAAAPRAGVAPASRLPSSPDQVPPDDLLLPPVPITDVPGIASAAPRDGPLRVSRRVGPE